MLWPTIIYLPYFTMILADTFYSNVTKFDGYITLLIHVSNTSNYGSKSFLIKSKARPYFIYSIIETS